MSAPSERLREYAPPASIGTPKNPDGTINYGYLDLGEWWLKTGCGELGRGFVSNARFASNSTERVIPRTNRSAQRKAAKR